MQAKDLLNNDLTCADQVLRQILCLSNSDEEKLALYKEAATLLSSFPLGSFPPKEVSWLVATCFNCGCQHAKFCRNESAVEFMEAAINLLDFCPELQAKKDVSFFSGTALPGMELNIQQLGYVKKPTPFDPPMLANYCRPMCDLFDTKPCRH